jgi:deoxyribodipyrimidine photolyase-related protein
MGKTLILLLPVHLFDDIDSLEKLDKHEKVYLLFEEPLYFSDPARIVAFNGLKILLHRVSMKLYENRLKTKGLDVRYFDTKVAYSNLQLLLAKEQIDKIIYYDPVDHLVKQRLQKVFKMYNTHMLDNPGFICKEAELEEYVFAHKNHKRPYFQNDFYRWQRKRLNILMDENGDYLGGKLSFDKDNRGGYPDYKMEYPAKYHHTRIHPYIRDAINYFKSENIPYLGKLDVNYGNWHHLAFDSNTAREKLYDFLKHRLHSFGKYQDIIDAENPWVLHSLLSHTLNIGLLTPKFVVDEAINWYYNNEDKISINNIEGFVRQIIGWREYYRMVYLYKYDELVKTNYLNHNNKLNNNWYTAHTNLYPVDHSIYTAFELGYLHHIVRLMVVGQFMLLCEIHPNEIYKWFMEFAIDSYDWVMVPNVYGMVGYNDGGATTTKVYISSSNYILKMSNFKDYMAANGIKDDWIYLWRALYYRFIHKHQALIKKNPRTRRMLWHMERIEPPKLQKLIDDANTYLHNLNTNISINQYSDISVDYL